MLGALAYIGLPAIGRPGASPRSAISRRSTPYSQVSRFAASPCAFGTRAAGPEAVPRAYRDEVHRADLITS